ncbi:DUF3068 domain-containing protein [Rhodococcus sp. BP-316]|uniref:DUF3068 domain-containing protein n=1 Tax=Rhodococcus sp. BP-316 TaxID=2739445 RepID=UPI001C9A79E0|nr:DUF3068 domain-containing protein [Rhodococcus sp. BP-316]MBY6680363.1 DUF3068 domain-containing protein [Rhodococcus sp. BP-316]
MANRSTPTRVIPPILIGLGAFFLVIAILIPLYMVGRLEKTPLDLEITSVSTGTGSVLDSRSLTAGSAVVDQNVPLISQRFVTTEEPSNSDVITVQAGSSLRRTDRQGDTGLLTATVDRVSLDRVSSMPVDPVGSIQSQADKPAEEVPHTGLQYKFPFDSQKQTYPFFDTVARESYDMTFVEETQIEGVTVYHYTQTIPAVDLSAVVPSPANKLALPASTWGVDGGATPITMTRYYENTRDIYVEPVTGVIVKGQEDVHQYYARRAGTPEVDVVKAVIGFDDNTVTYQLGRAQDGKDQIALIGRTVPIVAGVLGVILLAVGIVLLLRGGRTTRGTRPVADGPTTGPRTSGAGSPAPDHDWTTDRTEEIPRTNLRKD